MFRERVLRSAVVGAAVAGAFALTATAQAETSVASAVPSPAAANSLSKCTITAVWHHASVTCKAGSGSVRVALECELFDGSSKVVYGPWVGVNETSQASCHTLDVLDRWYETS